MQHSEANECEAESFDPSSGIYRVDPDGASRDLAQEWFDGRKRTERAKRLKMLGFPTWLKSEHRIEIAWFFRHYRQTKSATAAAIAIAQEKLVAAPCARCGGNEEKNDGGTGFIHSKGRQKVTQEQADRLALLGIDKANLPPDIGDQLCPECKGRGWLIGKRKPKRLRADKAFRPPGLSPFRAPRGQAPGLATMYENKKLQPGTARAEAMQMHEDLTRLGQVLKMFGRTEELEDGDAVAVVFDSFHGPDGGSVGALWHLTPAGRKLMRINPYKLHHRQLFENLRNEQQERPDANRAALFKAADAQAKELYERCCQLWNEANCVVATEHEDDIDHALSTTPEAP